MALKGDVPTSPSNIVPLERAANQQPAPPEPTAARRGSRPCSAMLDLSGKKPPINL